MLEMAGPSVTPEEGVTRYENDHTQGPACAIAAGAATIYRNYFLPINGASGQTSTRQVDGIRDVGDALAKALGVPASELWIMKNGYLLPEARTLNLINSHLRACDEPQIDNIRTKLSIGLHSDVEVTDVNHFFGPKVSQAFCSALPVAYSSIEPSLWKNFASLVLEAAYEATLWSALRNLDRGASDKVFLTLLGGGAFGNETAWIHRALKRAIALFSNFPLDIRLVSYHEPPYDLQQLVEGLKR